MSFALGRLREMCVSGPVARVVVAASNGSVPREVGAAMVISSGTVEGTIGGGALEFEAISQAREALAGDGDRLNRMPLGPSLGQCCGGSVSVLTEVWDQHRLAGISGEVVARPLPGDTGEASIRVRQLVAAARGQERLPEAGIIDGWMIEPIARPEREIWVWGAGHVGRAIIAVLAPIPWISIRWVDCDSDRFPNGIPSSVETLIAANPADLVTIAPAEAEHFVLTYSHALDLELCHRILAQPFKSFGLIGSATKWARFRRRLKALGHAPGQISRITCPIGYPALGKHPQAIALGLATDILATGTWGTKMIGERA